MSDAWSAPGATGDERVGVRHDDQEWALAYLEWALAYLTKWFTICKSAALTYIYTSGQASALCLRSLFSSSRSHCAVSLSVSLSRAARAPKRLQELALAAR